MSYAVNTRGATKRPLPASFSRTAAPANFGVATPPGTVAPSMQYSSVPGVSTVPPRGIANPFSVGAVRATAGFPSQELQTSPHVVKPHSTGYHNRLGSGQAIFFSAKSNKGDDAETIVSLPQFNEILRKAYKLAVTSGMTERSNKDDTDTFEEYKTGIEEDMEDSVARQRRHLDEKNKESANTMNALNKLKNVNEGFWNSDETNAKIVAERAHMYLQYLNLESIMDNWTYGGFVRNIEMSDSTFKVLNRAYDGPLMIDNYWGPSLYQLSNVAFVVKRVLDKNGQYGEFAVLPWSEKNVFSAYQVQSAFPSMTDLHYEDLAGYAQQGQVISVGQVSRVDTPLSTASRSSARLAGVERTDRAEHEAWRETNNATKAKVLVTLGHTAQNKCVY